MSRDELFLSAKIFRLFGAGVVSIWSRVYSDFYLLAQTERVCTKHLLRLYRQCYGDCRESEAVLCGLETYRCPRTVLCKKEAERCPFAS